MWVGWNKSLILYETNLANIYEPADKHTLAMKIIVITVIWDYASIINTRCKQDGNLFIDRIMTYWQKFGDQWLMCRFSESLTKYYIVLSKSFFWPAARAMYRSVCNKLFYVQYVSNSRVLMRGARVFKWHLFIWISWKKLGDIRGYKEL